MDRVECIVVGAGVVELAVARAQAMAGREVIVIEVAGDIGTGTSSRNSEVIHAGIYYPAGSAMARLCVAGKQMMYRYSDEHGVPNRRRGKLIVATGAVDTGGDTPMTLGCNLLINAAGLNAPDLARAIEGLPPEHIPTAYYAKGNYFACTTRVPFSHLIYPLPEPGGLGVHLTLDIGGAGRFGPDVEWVETLAYDVDPKRAERFYPAIRRYWPDLPDGALVPAYSGIRPKIVPPSIAVQDFLIQDARLHGVPGLINLFGIESPGLTASLAIAEEVRALTSPR